MTAIKICGLNTKDTVTVCRDAGSDYVGFVCYPNSPRHVEPDIFATLAAEAAPLTTVLVTVNAEDALLEHYFDAHRPDYLQCHGSESPQRVAELKERFSIKIIKALPVQTADDLTMATDYALCADMLLLDAKPAKGEMPGGNARSFDWQILDGVTLPLPWMLSGGLTCENIASALAASHATMIDISSGVERSRGVKDPEAIREFIHHVQYLPAS